MRRGLSIDIIEPSFNQFGSFGSTYRNEGLSLAESRMRMDGAEVPMEVTYSDLRIGKKIGSGACSNVFIAHHVRSGTPYAVKMFNVYVEDQARQLLKEISLLANLQEQDRECEALISLKGAFHVEGNIGVILEYMDQGSIEFMLQVRPDEEVFAAVFFQIIWGLAYLHHSNNLHRDVKPANVLINSQGFVKISDFGISKALDNSVELSSTHVGTCRYMSPERLQGMLYDKSGDVWSVGIMVMELWLGTYPFAYCCSTPVELLHELETLRIDILLQDGRFPLRLQSFIEPMLRKNPASRMRASVLIHTEWFKSFGLFNLEIAQQIVSQWLCSVGRSQDEFMSISSPDEKAARKVTLGSKLSRSDAKGLDVTTGSDDAKMSMSPQYDDAMEEKQYSFSRRK